MKNTQVARLLAYVTGLLNQQLLQNEYLIAENRILRSHLPARVRLTNAQRAVSASYYDHALKVWDLESGRVLRTLEDHSGSVTSIALTPDGKHAVSASDDYTLKVWDLENGRWCAP